MTQTMEKIEQAILKDLGPIKCPFQPDKPGKANKTKPVPDDDADNYTYNDSGELGDNMLADANASCPPENQFPPTPLDLVAFQKDGPRLATNVGVKPNPHHLIPGHASLPYTTLAAYMGDKPNLPESCEDDSRIKSGGGGIDYDVNDAANGMWLPSNNALKGKWTLPAFQSVQAEYAFLAINRADAQFHDAHTDYNNWIIKLLDQLCEKLEHHISVCKLEPCKSVRENANRKLPVAPYPFLKDALNAVSARLRKYMKVTQVTRWTIPKVTTSRLSITYAKIHGSASPTPGVRVEGGKEPVVVTEYAIKVVKKGLNTWARKS